MRISTVLSNITQVVNRDHSDLQDLEKDDHPQYLKEKASGGAASETPEHTHESLAECHKLDHGKALDGLGDDDHEQYLDVAETRLPKKIVYGNTASKPATPVVGDLYFDTQTQRLNVCIIAEAWTEVNPKAHDTSHLEGGSDELDASNIKNASAKILTTQGDILIRGAAGIERLGIGASGKVITSQGAGANPVWGETALASVVAEASAVLQNSNDDDGSTNSISYVKTKEVLLKVTLAGCRIKFKISNGNAANTTYAQIYKNGTPIGIERTKLGTEYKEFSEDFADFVIGDLIQIYVKTPGGTTAHCKEMRIYYDYVVTLAPSAILTNLAECANALLWVTNQDPE